MRKIFLNTALTGFFTFLSPALYANGSELLKSCIQAEKFLNAGVWVNNLIWAFALEKLAQSKT